MILDFEQSTPSGTTGQKNSGEEIKPARDFIVCPATKNSVAELFRIDNFTSDQSAKSELLGTFELIMQHS